ncbi:response regulator transcription factor [Spirosoma rigui]|uniref:response regulator transcription factor n=1 Tax=Spirosoma rigui TaxID=564064 RepID=UPI0014750592|nr:response regulator transcription factor [Spirosoma rigui]
MKILLIEPDGIQSEPLSGKLLAAGHRVCVVRDGLAGWQLIQIQAYDMILVTPELPQLGGYELVRALRQEDPQLPVLMLGTPGRTDQQQESLLAGASQFLARPLQAKDLLLEIRTLYRKFYIRPPRWLRRSGLDLNLTERTVYRNGRGIDLTERECHLLAVMMRAQGQVLQREFLLQQVWGITDTSRTNTLDVHINYLRKKIDQDFSPKLIQTIVGVGYKLLG